MCNNVIVFFAVHASELWPRMIRWYGCRDSAAPPMWRLRSRTETRADLRKAALGLTSTLITTMHRRCASSTLLCLYRSRLPLRTARRDGSRPSRFPTSATTSAFKMTFRRRRAIAHNRRVNGFMNLFKFIPTWTAGGIRK